MYQNQLSEKGKIAYMIVGVFWGSVQPMVAGRPCVNYQMSLLHRGEVGLFFLWQMHFKSFFVCFSDTPIEHGDRQKTLEVLVSPAISSM